MITCPNCDIQYSPSFACCPKCKEHVTPSRDRDRYMIQNASDRISQGEDPGLVRHDLIVHGFVSDEADAVVDKAMRELQSENREEGRRQIAHGVGMLFMGGMFLFVVLGAAAGFRFGRIIWLLIGGGLVAMVYGFYKLLTGR